MSEIKQEPIFMEQDEYLDYLRNQIKAKPELASAPIAQMNMYQMNKDLVRGLKKMNNMDINHALEKVRKWYTSHNEYRYFALLNHEQRYFTIFHEHLGTDNQNVPDSFIRELKDILVNYYGDHDLRAIDVNGDTVEIWAMWNGEPTVAYLFPYDQGVVQY